MAKKTESWKSGQSQKEISKRRGGERGSKQKGRNKKEGRKQVGGVLNSSSRVVVLLSHLL